MVLLRSEGEVPDTGDTLTAAQLWELSVAWYGDRLDPAWRPRTREESQRLLADLGLEGAFWQLR
jgi:hypothetical protein